MPNIPALPYQEFPDLHLILDFLGRCEADGQCMAARYERQRELQTAEAACARLQIYPPQPGFAGQRHGNAGASQHLRVSRADWHALSKTVFYLLEPELRRLFYEAGHGAATMRSPQRRPPALTSDAGPGSGHGHDPVPGFQAATQQGAGYPACHGDHGPIPAASSMSLLEHHFSLMLRIGLQLLAAGDVSVVAGIWDAIARAGKSPLLMELQALVQTYCERLALRSSSSGPDPLEEAVLHECLETYREWRSEPTLGLADALSAIAAPALHARAPETSPEMHPIDGKRSAFQRVRPHAPAAGERAPAQKRGADASPGGDMKRFRIGLDRLSSARPGDGEPPGTQGGRAPILRPVILLLAEDLPPLEPTEQGRFAAPATAPVNSAAGRPGTAIRGTLPVYLPPGVGMTEGQEQARSGPGAASLATMSGFLPAPRIVHRNPQPAAWRQSLATTTLFEPRMYQPPRPADGLQRARIYPAAPGPAPAIVQAFELPFYQKTGLNI